ncbi:component of the signal recognition particle (SRP) protein-targeting pathway [Clostridiaceae bacterium BL-3]|nr:component of the signal recognition particle (SRP) protein-targeting pathway [Clostridiaceae bacterium BL-3]
MLFILLNKRDDSVEERIRLSVLLDIYGELLTKKQRDVMELYYDEDLSLREIAEHTNTSRQAVYDIIKRCHKLLLEYEDKLHILKKRKNLEENKKSILKFIDSLCCSGNEEVLNKVKDYVKKNI